MLILGLFIKLFPLIALGYVIGRFKPGISSQIAQPLVNFGVPLSFMGFLLRSGLDWLLVEALAMALFGIGLLIALIRIFPKLRRRIGSQSLLLGSVFGNSGYFGIPVSLLLLPSTSLSFSIGYDIGATLLIWSLGPILLAGNSSESKDNSSWENLLGALTTSPASKGLIGALFIQWTPWSQLITSALWIPSKIVIALALMVLGIRLGSFDLMNKYVNQKLLSLILPSLFIKLIMLPILMSVLTIIFGLPTAMSNALVIQAATPTAISVLLLAEANGKEEEVAAALVAWSTVIGFITVPVWFLFLSYINEFKIFTSFLNH